MGHGASTQAHSVTDISADVEVFKWETTKQAKDASDILCVMSANREIQRIRKIAKHMAPSLKCSKHVALAEGSRAEEIFKGSIEDARKEVVQLRKLMQSVNRIEAVHCIFEKIDVDHTNFITQAEMTGFLLHCKHHITKEELEEERLADDDEDEESHKAKKQKRFQARAMVFASSAFEEAKVIFKRADMSYSHSLDFHEFYEYMLTLFHVAFDLIAEGAEIIKPTQFKHLLAFIYGKHMGERKGLAHRTAQAKNLKMRKVLARKVEELERELGERELGRDLFIDYLLHCYKDHNCSRLYFNLMHLTVKDADWTTSMKNAYDDIVKETSVDKAEKRIGNVDTSDNLDTGGKEYCRSEALEDVETAMESATAIIA